MRPELTEPIKLPVPNPVATATANEAGAMILIAALMNMLGDNQVILDEADVNVAIKSLEQKRLVVTQNDADHTVTVSLEEM